MLTLVSKLDKRAPDKHILGLYRCACGNTKEIKMSSVRNGTTRSCGCLVRTASIVANRTHGMRGTPTYRTWQAMKRRCEVPSDKDFPRYGAVGIRLCERWFSFENFLYDMGERPPNTSIDRIDGRMGYSPNNCRWADAVQQARNTRNFVVVSTPLGAMSLIDYAPRVGLTRGAAHMRLKRGKLEGCERI